MSANVLDGQRLTASRDNEGCVCLLSELGRPVGYFVSGPDAALLAELKRDNSPSPQGLVAIFVTVLVSLVLTGSVLYAIWQDGRATGRSEAAVNHR